jgi:hypothetical protein
MQHIKLVVVAMIAVLSVVIIAFVFLNQPADWVTVASWNGQTTEFTMTTEPFNITRPEWRVNWQVSSYNVSAYCDISVYDATTNGLVNGSSTQREEIDMNVTGSFYLQISVHGKLNSWAVYVFERAQNSTTA